MKKIRSVWISMALLFFALGALLVHAVNQAGHFADACALGGGTLLGLSLFFAYMAFEQHRQLRALDRHLHPHHHHHAHTSERADT